MYDPKFEKVVQRKMEELEFRPSESVWVNIEKTFPEQRRRRGVPFFWRLLIPAVLLAAVCGAYYFGEKAGRKAGATAVAAKMADPVGENGSGRMTAAKAEKVAKTAKAAKATMPAGEDRGGTVGRKASGKLIKTRRPAGVQGEEVSGSADIAAYLYRPGLEDQRLSHRVSGAALRSDKNLIKLSTLSRVRRPWEAGFVAGAGFDRLNLLDGVQVGTVTFNPAALQYGLNSIGTKNYISEVRPGASFYAGIYLQKPLSDRWVFHTGMGLHYYSTSMSIGHQVNVVVPSAPPLNPTTTAIVSAPLVFTVSDQQTYTNRYYMLELPVSVQYRINRSKLLPLFLEGGGSVSRLMGADALFYSPTTGLVKSENVLHKTQFNVSSALLVGFPFHGIRIQTGPEVQYGLTPLINGQGLGDQHFFYAGVRLVVLPGRR